MTHRERIYNAIQDAKAQRITPDDYRALVREIVAEIGQDGYERERNAALIADDRS